MLSLVSPIPLSAYGGAVGTTLAWRHRGELRLTVVLKAAFALAPDALAEPIPGAELWLDEGADHPSDLIPVLAQPEVIVVGHACAPANRTVPSMSVRLFVGGDGPAVDKTLHVYGDRAGVRSEPTPFERLPLGYDRAVGGPGTENPAGRRPDGSSALPNVVHPSEPWMPAGLGPIPSTWPGRRRSIRSRAPFVKDGVLEVPDDMGLDYFQASPPDQRLPTLRGDEWIVIDGMHPTFTRLQSQLPGSVARARLIATRGDNSRTLDLVVDRLFVDMDRLTATLLWRGGCPLPAEPWEGQVVAGVESPAEDELEESSSTMVFDEAELARLSGGALPWAPTLRRSSPGKALGGLPFGRLDEPAPPPATALEWSNDETVTISGDELGAALPFGAGPAGPASRAERAVDLPGGRPPAFAVPTLVSLEPDDEASGQTAVAPIPDSLRDALPFAADAPVAEPAASEPAPALAAPALSEPAPALAGPESEPAPPVAPAASEPAPALAAPALSEPAPALAGSLVEPDGVRQQLLARIRAGGEIGAPLSGADLSGLDLRGARLSGADLSGARFVNADLTGAKLSGAKLVGADLSGAKLSGADLSRADLVRATLGGADLSGADLSGATMTLASGDDALFRRARCDRASLSQGRWARADFEEASLVSVDLSGARVDAARFERADLSDATLTEIVGEDVCLRSAKLGGANATGATLPGVDLAGALGERSVWEGAEIDRGCLDRCSLKSASLVRASLIATTARQSVLDDADLSNATAEGADFEEASLVRAQLRQAKLNGAKLGGASLQNANLQRAVANDADLRRVDLRGASLRAAKLSGANLSDAAVDGADFRDANLSGARLSGVDRSRAKLAGANLKDVVD